YHALKQSVEALQKLGSGATFAEISKTQLEGFEIPLPPLAEQRRIAAILKEQMAAVEKARVAAEEELNTINALPAALLCRAFNGEV
ncbi:MAG: restriction endonuclease subunit S, partial [Verrucomicrobia bacterium]|nr:restriction endonuclease subunit S [Verrucomicrobiota bacterium]